MRYIRNDKGVALMMVMVLSVLVLAISSTIFYMITVGTQTSGMAKRFSTMQEAAKGAENLIQDFAMDGAVSGDAVTMNIPDAVRLDDKRTKDDSVWPSTYNKKIDIDTTSDSTYDFKFTLDSYTVYGKIVNTITGNSDTSSGSAGAGTQMVGVGVVSNLGGSGGGMMQIPYDYIIEYIVINTNNPNEKAQYSMLLHF